MALAGCGDTQNVDAPPPPAPTADETGAREAAATFVRTAVARKNLDASWPVTHPELRIGYTRARWRQGTIPVQFLPKATARPRDFRVAESTAAELSLRVNLELPDGTRYPFLIGVKRFGAPPRWGVSYFAPAIGPPPTSTDQG